MAGRVYVVAASSQVGDADLRAMTERCRGLLGPSAELDVIALADDQASSKTVRERVQAALGVRDCVTLPSRADLLREAARVEPPMTLHAPRRPVSQALSRLARNIAGLKVGLALGAGAAKGVAHVGVLEMLQELDVPIDVVAGTSVGAVVGAGVAMGLETQQIQEGMDRLVDAWDRALKPVLSRHGRYDPRVLDQIARGAAGDVRFDELQIPFGAVSTDLNTGRTIFICEGSVAQAVRASINIPMAFPPLLMGDFLLVDGFVTNPVPATLTRQLGADVVLACNLSGPATQSQQASLEMMEPVSGGPAGKQKRLNILDTLLRCAYLMMDGRGDYDSLSADVTFRPHLPDMGLKDFQKGGPPLQAGRQAVEDQIESMRELLPWLRVAQ
jgi:NTE family protein